MFLCFFLLQQKVFEPKFTLIFEQFLFLSLLGRLHFPFMSGEDCVKACCLFQSTIAKVELLIHYLHFISSPDSIYYMVK